MEIPAIGIFIGKVKLTPMLPLRDNDTVEENSILSISLIAKGLQTGKPLTRPSVNGPIIGWSPKSPRSKFTSFAVLSDVSSVSFTPHDGRYPSNLALFS